MSRYSLIGILCLILLPAAIFAQNKTQTVRGQVFDSDTRQPIVGATVFVENTDPTIGGISDEQGNFKLLNVPIGRQTVKCRYPGYANYGSDNVIITSAKELVLVIEMTEEIGETTSEEVLITANEYPTKAVNELAVVSTRSFSAEETERYAASVNDPGRMALAFPGVQQGGDDSENDIIIRGNSSFGMLWRLEGIDIPNPNHFARAGTSGGGITIFSAQLLARSDFSTGAMPSEYGNAISGAFDMHFRKGNMEQREYRIKVGLLGLDFATEGPIQKGRSSYLVNYRYSTLSLLNEAGFNLVGENVDNDFQDLSFNLAFDGKDGKSFTTVFGISGISQEHYLPREDTAQWERRSHWEDRVRSSDMLALGVTHTRTLDEKSYIKFVLAGMISNISYNYDTLTKEKVPGRYNTEKYLDQRISTSITYNRKFSSRTRLKVGVHASHINFEFFRSRAPQGTLNFEINLDGEGSTQQIQTYAQINHRLSEKLTMNAGFHLLNLTLNGTTVIEPRASLKYQINPRISLSAAYGLHSQLLPLGLYFVSLEDSMGVVSQPNIDLKPIRSHHAVLSYNHILGKGMRIQIEGYMQRQFQVPVRPDAQFTWWMLNNRSGIAEFELTSEGTGWNYGIDVALERYFSNGLFFLFTGSKFESNYQALDGITYNTRFATEWASSYTIGKEFEVGKKGSILQIGARVLYNGGFRYTPHDPIRSLEEGRFVALDANSNSLQVGPYFRIDTRIAYRINKPKSSQIIQLDIQNVMNRPNNNNVGYDPITNELFFRNHPSGLIPILSWQIDF